MHAKTTVITAERVVTGTDSAPLTPGAVVIEGDTIHAVGSPESVAILDDPGVRRLSLAPGQTLTPGMVDVHTHLIMPGDGTPYQTFLQHSDATLVLQALKNAQIHLNSGVTTLADTGARGRTTFSLRDAIRLGFVSGPRLVLCGRPITRTGGHCWFLGEEADGPAAVTRSARQLLKEGADIIKVMATGGGTAGTFPHRPSLFVDELEAAAREAHENGKPAIAHVSATEGIRRTLDAGFDVIFHCHFYEADSTLNYQDDLARRIADTGTFVNPTLWVNGIYVDLLHKKAAGGELTAAERETLALRSQRYAGQRENVGKLATRGVRLVAGSDAGWGRYEFGDLVIELEEMVGVGLSASDAVLACTSRAAAALGVADQVGSIEPGKKADLLVVNGDPTANISALRDIDTVMLGGEIVRSASWANC
jgi:imidazolonepropionase-like amidohydrolase